MPLTYILLEKAQLEYEESLLWYASRSNRAAVNFVIAVDAALLLICNNPARWRNRYKNFYELGLRKYPFSIIYNRTCETISNNHFCVSSQKKSPETLQKISKPSTVPG